MKPINKPKKKLTKVQSKFLNDNKSKYTKPQLNSLTKSMKKGFCIEQSINKLKKKK